MFGVVGALVLLSAFDLAMRAWSGSRVSDADIDVDLDGLMPPKSVPPPRTNSSRPPTTETWDSSLLTEAVSNWEREFDAMQGNDEGRENAARPWSHEELVNADQVQQDDFLPAADFVIGDPGTYDSQKMIADFGFTWVGDLAQAKFNRIADKKAALKRVSDFIAKYRVQHGNVRLGPAQLQMALQKAGIKSRYVVGHLATINHAWVEADIRGDGSFAYVIDPDSGSAGRKTNRKSGGMGEQFEIEKAAGLTYEFDPDRFNVIWRRRSTAGMTDMLRPAFTRLCQQIAMRPEYRGYDSTPEGRAEIADRVAQRLVEWVSKTPDERGEIMNVLPGGQVNLLERVRSLAAKLSPAASDKYAQFFASERWFRVEDGLSAAASPQSIPPPPMDLRMQSLLKRRAISLCSRYSDSSRHTRQ